MESFIHRGIVIQNDDPERMGRVKIFFPNVSVSLYKNWREEGSDLAFKFVGANLDSDLTDIIEPLKQILPWAEAATPFSGGSSSGRYQAGSSHGSVSDSPVDIAKKGNPVLNSSGLDEKPGYKYEINPPVDAFSGNNNTLRSNPLSASYAPSTYSNAAKGNFDVPCVGAKLWCFFENNDPNFPVYFAATHDKDEWASIYDITTLDKGLDYPEAFENDASPDVAKRRVFRHKHVISEKGGTIEIINTDNKESIKLSQASGANICLCNEGIIVFSHKHHNVLVLSDSFETIRGDKSLFVGGFKEEIIEKDSIKRVGKWESAKDAMEAWLVSAKKLGEVKQLFEIRRCASSSDTSPQQIKGGVHAPHPLSNGKGLLGTRTVLNQPLQSIESTHGKAGSVHAMGGEVLASKEATPPSFRGRLSPSSMDGEFTPEPKKDALNQLAISLAAAFKEAEQRMGEGGNDDQKVTKDATLMVGAVMNDLPAVRIDDAGRLLTTGVTITDNGAYPSFTASALVEKVHVDTAPFGNYSVFVGSKYEIAVGSGGYSLMSTGIVDFLSPMVNFSTKEYNILSQKNVNIITDTFFLSANKICIKNSAGDSLAIDGNLGITKNLAVVGGAYVDGGIYTKRLHTLKQWEQTQPIVLKGKIIGGLPIGTCKVGDVTSVECDLAVEIYEHSHAYHIPATEFYMTSAALVDASKILNAPLPAEAKQIKNNGQ